MDLPRIWGFLGKVRGIRFVVGETAICGLKSFTNYCLLKAVFGKRIFGVTGSYGLLQGGFQLIYVKYAV